MARRVLVVLLAGLALASPGPTAAGHPTATADVATVTLSVRRFLDKRTGLYQFFFTGAISSRSEGEYVSVLFERCGQSFATTVAGTTTNAAGVWGASPTSISLEGGSGLYRARWRDELSAPVRLRPPIGVYAVPLGAGKIRVSVTTWETAQDLSRRVVVLQQLRKGTWVDVRRARLARETGQGWPTYAATFTYPRRGVTLRAAVPAPTAAPCFRPGVSAKLES